MGRDSSVGCDFLRAEQSGDRIPVEARFSSPFHTGPGGLPSIQYNQYRVIPGYKAAEAWRLPLSPSNTEVKVRVQLASTSLLGLRGRLR